MKKAKALCDEHGHRAHGFSLIELMVAVALLAVLASVAIPSFANITRQFRVSTVADELIASIQWSRVEAVRMGQEVVLRRITGCARDLRDLADWGCGWRVFADLNANGELDGTDFVLQVVDVPAGVSINKVGAGNLQTVRIDRFGRSIALGQRIEIFPTGLPVTNGQLVCFSTATRTRRVINATECGAEP